MLSLSQVHDIAQMGTEDQTTRRQPKRTARRRRKAVKMPQTEQQRQDLKRAVAAAKLEDTAARTIDPELSREYLRRAAALRRQVEEGG